MQRNVAEKWGGNQRRSLQKCANSSDCGPISACATDTRIQPEYLVLFSMFSVEFCLRSKPYLVVKIASNVLTEHFCHVCVLAMIRSKPNWITGPAPKSGSAGVTWTRKRGFKMAATELGYLFSKLSFWLSLWRDITISWHGGKALLVWYVLQTIPSVCGPMRCRYSTEKCLLDPHLPYVYVVILSISPF